MVRRGNWTFYDENGVKERETEHKSGQEEGIYTLFMIMVRWKFKVHMQIN